MSVIHDLFYFLNFFFLLGKIFIDQKKINQIFICCSWLDEKKLWKYNKTKYLITLIYGMYNIVNLVPCTK